MAARVADISGASKAHWSAADVYKEMAFNGLKAAIQTANAPIPDNGSLELATFFLYPIYFSYLFVVFFHFSLFLLFPLPSPCVSF